MKLRNLLWQAAAVFAVSLYLVFFLSPVALAQEGEVTPVPGMPGGDVVEPAPEISSEEPAENSAEEGQGADAGQQDCIPGEDPSCQPATDLAPAEIFSAGEILVSHASGGQQYPDSAANPLTNEVLVVWQDNRSGSWEIYAQRVNNQGAAIGEPILVSNATDPQRKPKVACEPVHGRWVVVWQQDTNPAIIGRLVASDGVVEGSTFYITTGTLARTNPDVTYNPLTQQFLAVWEYADPAGSRNISGRLINISAEGNVTTGSMITVSDLAEDEFTPAVVANPLSPGDYLVVWIRDLSGDNNVVGRRVHADGSLTGYSIFRISPSDATADENQPAVTVNSQSGTYLVAWRDTRNGNSNTDIYARQVSVTGVVGSSLAIDIRTGNQERPALAYNPAANQYLVAWEDGDVVYAQRINASQSLVGSRTSVSLIGAVPLAPSIARTSSGFWIFWHDLRTPEADVYGRSLDSSAVARSNEANLSLSSGYSRGRHSLAFSPVGQRWLVVWAQNLVETAGENNDILGQFVDISGRLVGEVFNICSDPDDQEGPKVAYNLARDEFMVAWQDFRNGSRDIYAQRLDADGTLIGGAIQVTTNDRHQEQVSLVYNDLVAGGQYLLAWTDSRNDPGNNSNADIYARRLRGDGTFFDTGDFPVVILTGRQEAPSVGYDPLDRQYLVAWRDNTGGGRVAAQRIGEGAVAPQGSLIVVSSEGGATGLDVAVDDQNGIYLVVWSTLDAAPNTGDIHGRLVDGSGVVLSASDIVLSNASGWQHNPTAGYSQHRGHYFSAWVDDHTTYGDLDGQALAPSGSLLYTPSDSNLRLVAGTAPVSVPRVAFSDGTSLLSTWGDQRADYSLQIYARLGQANSMSRLYLPYTIRN